MNRIFHSGKLLAALALVALLGAGCATQRGVRPETSAAFAQMAVPGVVQDKVRHAGLLSVSDLASALEAGVPESAASDYVRSSRAVYHLETTDVDRLRAVGASDEFINQLLATPSTVKSLSGYGGYYRAPYPYYGYGYRHGYGYGYRCY